MTSAAPADRLEMLLPTLASDGESHFDDVFAPKAVVDSPRSGVQPWTEWAVEEAAWLSGHSAWVESGPLIATKSRIAHELVCWVDTDDDVCGLPVIMVADMKDDLVAALRIYHSTYPLTGGHQVRAPILKADESLKPAAPVDAYEAALRAADADAVNALFEADGYVREPSGSEFKHAGEDRMKFYAPALSKGPIPLELCTIIDDGNILVFEYNCKRWGSFDIPPQCGAAAYARSADGKIAAARIYDDIDPPSALFT